MYTFAFNLLQLEAEQQQLRIKNNSLTTRFIVKVWVLAFPYLI
jgi:hypothetical protein